MSKKIELSTMDLPVGFTELNPKPNQEIEVRIISTWNPCDFIGINRWGHAVVTLHDKSVLTLNGFHEVRGASVKGDSDE